MEHFIPKIDVIQLTKWNTSFQKFYRAKGKRYKLFWMGGEDRCVYVCVCVCACVCVVRNCSNISITSNIITLSHLWCPGPKNRTSHPSGFISITLAGQYGYPVTLAYTNSWGRLCDK